MKFILNLGWNILSPGKKVSKSRLRNTALLDYLSSPPPLLLALIPFKKTGFSWKKDVVNVVVVVDDVVAL